MASFASISRLPVLAHSHSPSLKGMDDGVSINRLGDERAGATSAPEGGDASWKPKSGTAFLSIPKGGSTP